MAAYGFRRAQTADLPLLNGWLARPHVARWWGEDASFDGADPADPRRALWVVSLGDVPFACLQDYDVHGWPDHHFAQLPPGSRGIDQFIGEPALLNRGHGTAFIRQRLEALIAGGAPAVGTDPHPDNAQAIAAYGKAGFRVAGGPVDTPWGRVLRMRCDCPGVHPPDGAGLSPAGARMT
jgi:aminoglycoside 6'-N-acetyltransferase